MPRGRCSSTLKSRKVDVLSLQHPSNDPTSSISFLSFVSPVAAPFGIRVANGGKKFNFAFFLAITLDSRRTRRRPRGFRSGRKRAPSSSSSLPSVAMRLLGSTRDFSVREGKKFSFLRGRQSHLGANPPVRDCGRWQFSCSKDLCQNISVDAENLLLRIIRATTNSDLWQQRDVGSTV